MEQIISKIKALSNRYKLTQDMLFRTETFSKCQDKLNIKVELDFHIHSALHKTVQNESSVIMCLLNDILQESLLQMVGISVVLIRWRAYMIISYESKRRLYAKMKNSQNKLHKCGGFASKKHKCGPFFFKRAVDATQKINLT